MVERFCQCDEFRENAMRASYLGIKRPARVPNR